MDTLEQATPSPAQAPLPLPRLHRWPLSGVRAFAKDPVGYIGHLHRQGPLAASSLAGTPVLMVSEPELMREVLMTRAGELTKFKALPRIELLLGKGLFTTEGEEHKAHRRMAMPAFHRQAIGKYAALIVERAKEQAESWSEGQEVELPPVMSRMALDMMVRCLYGTALGDGVTRIQNAMITLQKLFNISTPVWVDRILLKLPLPSTLVTRKAVGEMDAVLREVLDRRRASAERQEDLLQMLLDARDEQGQPISPQELRDEAMTLLLAGHDTMAMTLNWTLALLTRHPEIQSAMRRDLDQVLQGRLPGWEDYPRLGSVERVYAEAMRLYPPGWVLGRSPKGHFTLGGHRFGRSTLIIMSSYWLHRDERFYPDPERFDPERFQPPAKEARPGFTYLPFSAGPRSCIGENFAWMQGVLILATLCQRWRFEAPEGQELELKPVARFLLSPEKAPRVVLRAV